MLADQAVAERLPLTPPDRASVQARGEVAEQAEVVVVGGRCAGAAVATSLARAGSDVVVLDRAAFPSDTLSTHLLWAGGVAELKRIGALERVLALGAPPLRTALAGWGGYEISGSYTPVEGVDYGLCVRRPGLDAALVATARSAGAEVREGASVTGLLRDPSGRICGVRWRKRPGEHERELRSTLVVGADGRRSLVGRLAGAEEELIEQQSGRGCYFAYWRDARPEWRHTAAQWRHGEELVTAFPCDGGLLLVLLMPPVERAAELRSDLEGGYDRIVASVPELAERLESCERASKVRHTPSTCSYFRRSSGPGWALAGDAGHFKDPVTAQGIRDAVRFGRLLGEAVTPTLGDPAATDRAAAGWEYRRNRECLGVYHWTNRLGRAGSMSPIEAELYRAAHRDKELGGRMLDVFSRTCAPGELTPPTLVARLTLRALIRARGSRRAVLAAAREELSGAAVAVRSGFKLRARNLRLRIAMAMR